MVRDLNFGIRVVGVPTVREADGLAMSRWAWDNCYCTVGPPVVAGADSLALALRAAPQHLAATLLVQTSGRCGTCTCQLPPAEVGR